MAEPARKEPVENLDVLNRGKTDGYYISSARAADADAMLQGKGGHGFQLFLFDTGAKRHVRSVTGRTSRSGLELRTVARERPLSAPMLSSKKNTRRAESSPCDSAPAPDNLHTWQNVSFTRGPNRTSIDLRCTAVQHFRPAIRHKVDRCPAGCEADTARQFYD